MDRDALLAAALGAAVVTGCTRPPERDPVPLPSASPTPEDPDVVVLYRWLDDERRLADRYAAVARRDPALAALRRNHRVRATAVGEHLRVRGLAVPAAATRPALRGQVASVAAALATAERELAARYVGALGAIEDERVVALGAELAAGARQHALLLGLVT